MNYSRIANNCILFLAFCLGSNFAEAASRLECIHDGATRHGTAFGIDLHKYGFAENRYLLTAAHNIVDKGDIRIEHKTHWYKCEVVAADKDLDICLLKCEEWVSVQELADKDAHAGDDVTMYGAPRAETVKAFKGSIVKQYYQKWCTTLMRIQFDHGDSGAPVFDTVGKIVGMAVAGLPKDGDLDKTVGTFLPVSAIESFLYENRCATVVTDSYGREIPHEDR